MNIYVWISGKVTGPFGKQEIFALLAEKKLGLQDSAFCEGDAEWTTVDEVLKRSAGALFSIDRIGEAHQEIRPAVRVVPHHPQQVSRVVPPSTLDKWIPKIAALLLVSGIAIVVFYGTTTQQRFRMELPSATSSTSLQPSTNISIAPVVQVPAAESTPAVVSTEILPSPLASVTPNIPITPPVENAGPSGAPPIAAQTGEATATRDSPVVEIQPTPSPAQARQSTIGALGSRSTVDFFKIAKIECVQKAPHDELRAAWLQLPATKFAWKTKQFVPYIEVQIQTAEQYLTKDTFVHVHFFDADNKLLETISEPVLAWKSPRLKYSLPVLLPKGKYESAYFPLPASVNGKQWTAIAVFGDQNSATSAIYPSTASMFRRDYPDKALVERRVLDTVAREAAIDPVTQVVIETLNPKQPTMTLFMRLPIGTRAGKEAKGVLAMCLLANNPTEIRQMLQRCDRDEDGRIYTDMKSAFQILAKLIDVSLAENLQNRLATRKPEDDARLVEDMQNILREMPVDPEDKVLNGCRNRVNDLVGRIYRNNLVKLADRHQLAILAWGARRLWNPKLSFDEQSRKTNREMDETFDDVARAWEKGVDKLSKQFGFPNNGFLLTGMSGAAQYACRLALRKPDRFLAVHVHIPSSFDKPTPEASKALWLLTTGEKEGGYPAAKRFFNECKGLGYPMIFKGIPGLGHQTSRIADQLGLEFFEYALSLKDAHEKLTANRSVSLLHQTVGLPEPWPDSFKKPAAIGDILNQDTFSTNDADFVPQNFRVALPTASITAAWKQ